jgi:RNA polymerase sigma-70 factor (ECF subfamily)
MEAAPETVEAPTETDEQLVARFRAGEEAAFDALVVRHRAATYRLAYRLTGRDEGADDLAQEAFLRAYRGLHRFRGESKFRTWMTRILMNLAITARRGRWLTEPLEEAAGRTPASQEGPEITLRHQVRRAVGSLPRRQRQILMLKVYEEMKFVEIADVAGISVGTAKATFFQAVQALRRRLLVRRLPRRKKEAEA